MNDRLFTRWQGGLFFLMLIAEGLYLPETVGAGACLVACLAVGLLGAGTLKLTVRKRTPEKQTQSQSDAYQVSRPVSALCRVRLPQTGTRAIFALLGLLAVWTGLADLARALRFLTAQTAPEGTKSAFLHSPALIGVLFLLVVLLLARPKETALSMWAYPTACLVALAVAIGLLCAIGDCTARDVAAFHQEALQMDRLAVLFPRFLPALLPLLCRSEKSYGRPRSIWCMGLGAGLLLWMMQLRTRVLLGVHAAKLYAYPALAAARIGSAFPRLGEVFGGVMTLAIAGRCAALLLAAKYALQLALSGKTQRKTRRTAE